MSRAIDSIREAQHAEQMARLHWEAQQASDQEQATNTRERIRQLPMRPASPDEYAQWLYRHLNLGGKISHTYDYSMPDDFKVATADFAIPEGCCGSLSFNVIVPAGISVTHAGFDHCKIYSTTGLGMATDAVLYSDIAAIIERWETERRLP